MSFISAINKSTDYPSLVTAITETLQCVCVCLHVQQDYENDQKDIQDASIIAVFISEVGRPSLSGVMHI